MKNVLLIAVLVVVGLFAQQADAEDTVTMSLGDHVFDPSQHVATRGSWSFVWLNYELKKRNTCDSGCQNLLNAALDLAIRELELRDITFAYIAEPNRMVGAILHHSRKDDWNDTGVPIAIAGNVFTLDEVNTTNGWSWAPITIHWGLVPVVTKVLGRGPGQWFEPFCEILDRVEHYRGKVYSFQVFQNDTGITGVKLRHKD